MPVSGEVLNGVLTIEVHALEVVAGDLERVEEFACELLIDVVVTQVVHDVHDGDLNGVGVFEDGKHRRFLEHGGAKATKGLIVEVASVADFQRGRATFNAVDFDMSALANFDCH